jgi:hypothetical protein
MKKKLLGIVLFCLLIIIVIVLQRTLFVSKNSGGDISTPSNETNAAQWKKIDSSKQETENLKNKNKNHNNNNRSHSKDVAAPTVGMLGVKSLIVTNQSLEE